MRTTLAISILTGIAMMGTAGCSRAAETPANAAKPAPEPDAGAPLPVTPAAATPPAAAPPLAAPSRDSRLPSWMPDYPGAKEVSITTTLSSIGGTRLVINFSTDDAPDKVLAFYKSKLVPLGFKQTQSYAVMIELSRPPESISITAVAAGSSNLPGANNKDTSVAIIMEVKKQ